MGGGVCQGLQSFFASCPPDWESAVSIFGQEKALHVAGINFVTFFLYKLILHSKLRLGFFGHTHVSVTTQYN